MSYLRPAGRVKRYGTNVRGNRGKGRSGRWTGPSIASLKGMDVAEGDAVQTALHQKYGKEVDLNGTPDDIREAVPLARL